VLAAIAGLGLCCGALIAVFPAAIGSTFGVLAGPRIYGRVFTEWGLPGLAAPWASAALYDTTGSYNVPLAGAAVISVASITNTLAFGIGGAK